MFSTTLDVFKIEGRKTYKKLDILKVKIEANVTEGFANIRKKSILKYDQLENQFLDDDGQNILNIIVT